MKIKCSNCGNILDRKPSQIKRNKNQFCNLICCGKYYKGKIFTKEHKRKISKAMKNRKITWGNKISITQKMNGTCKGKNNPMYGKHHSEETKLKISNNKERNKKISLALKGIKKPLGEKSHAWKGGKTNSKGYIYVYSPNHPYSNKKHVAEHRLIVENKIGRYLKKEEIIHHINEKRNDNRIENLMIFKNCSEHMKFHQKIRQFGITNPIKRQIENRWEEFGKLQYTESN